MSIYTYRRGSIFWALTLIGVGVIFLWQNFNPNVHPWQLLAKYWPILIIFWGLSKLIDYVQAQAHPDVAAPPLFSGIEVVRLILILILGTILSHVVLHPWQNWGWHINDDDLSNLFTNSYSYTQTFSQPLERAPHLMLENQRGDVEIRGADQPGIDVLAKKTVRADNEGDARKISDQLKLVLAQEAGHYVLRSNRNSLPDEARRVTIDLNLRVPISTSCEIDSQRGDISAEGLNGDQNLGAHNGDVHASNLQGLVKIHKYGGSLEVRGVKGSLDIDGRGDDVDVADVTDTVAVHGEFGGTLHFSKVGQTLHFQSLRTDMTAQKLSGNMEMETGSLEVHGIDGPFEIATRQKDVTVDEFRHTVRIADSNSDVKLATSVPPSHDIQVQSKSGAVELTLPANSNFQIEAASHHGEVECDFAGPQLKVVKQGDSPSISGSFGKGGPKIQINTEYGAIRILRAGAHHSDSDDSDGKGETTSNEGPKEVNHL